MRRILDTLVAATMLLLGRRRKPTLRPGKGERIVPAGEPSPRAELLVIGLLLASAVCAVAFPVFYALDRLPKQTQLLGSSLGMSLLFLAAALIVTARELIVTEEIEESYPAEEHPSEQEAIVAVVAESGSRITRKRLFQVSLGAVGGALTVALITPIVSLGPVFDMKPFYVTPWRRGRRLVDEQNRPYHASDIEEADFYTAFPEGADKENMAAPLILVRLPVGQLDLPPGNAGYAADGIVAYSKICTHAGCAISLYRTPLFQPDAPKPALVCPCHYSTFDPATGGNVLFGPAGRKLPMLPIYIDRRGQLRARGNFDEAVGPSWWGVRMKKPSTQT